MDLAPFTWINPCGYSGLATVDMRTMGVEAPLADVQQALARELVRQLATSDIASELASEVATSGELVPEQTN